MTQTPSSIITTRQPDGTQLVSGNTFPVKDILKRSGGTWDAGRKVWILPAEFSIEVIPAPRASQSSSVERPTHDDDNFGETPIATTQRVPRASPAEAGATMLISSTNTYKVKDQIVRGGGRWKPDTKQWEVPVDFDMSIIPSVETKPTTNAAVADDGKKPRVIHCSLCGQEGHAKNKCQCTHCGSIRMHSSEQCPTMQPRWKFLAQCPQFQCSCNATYLCSSCLYTCCREAKPLPCVCLLKTECATHGTNCNGEHD